MTKLFSYAIVLRPSEVYTLRTLREMHFEAHTRTYVTKSKIYNLKSTIFPTYSLDPSSSFPNLLNFFFCNPEDFTIGGIF
jgi:hypothetical protein